MPNRRMFFQWHRRESTPQSPRFGHRRGTVRSMVPVVVAALPICVPCRAYFSAPPDGLRLALAVLPGMSPSAPGGIWTPGTAAQRWSSCVTGRRALQAAPRGRSSRLTIATGITAWLWRLVHHIRSVPAEVEITGVGVNVLQVMPSLSVANPLDGTLQLPQKSLIIRHTGPLFVLENRLSLPQWSRMESNHRFPGCGPGAIAARPRDRISQVESPGVAPGSPACGAGVVLLDHDPKVFLQRKPWDSNPQAVFNRHLFSRQVPHPAGWLPLSSCGGWNRTNMKTFRASHPAVG